MVAIPLGQGQVFNRYPIYLEVEEMSQSLWVRDRFLMIALTQSIRTKTSQSLWVRDRFLIFSEYDTAAHDRRNPFGSGTGF